MRFMNTMDIDEAVETHRRHPVLSKATRFLAALRDEADSHSDGWAYWPAPARAAGKLIAMIEAAHPYNHDRREPTEAELTKALAPIRAFYTRRGYAAGMTFPTV